MSLKDPDEDYEDLVPEKKRKGKSHGKMSKIKLFFIILVIGFILGVIVGHYYLEPIINSVEPLTNNNDCLTANQLLSQENSCLYEQIAQPQQAAEKCTAST